MLEGCCKLQPCQLKTGTWQLQLHLFRNLVEVIAWNYLLNRSLMQLHPMLEACHKLPQAATLSTQNSHFTAAATAFQKSGRGHSLELHWVAYGCNCFQCWWVATSCHIVNSKQALGSSSYSFSQMRLKSWPRTFHWPASGCKCWQCWRVATSCHIVNSKQALYSCSYSFSKIW